MNFLKAIGAFFGSISILLAAAIMLFLILYIGYLFLIFVAIGMVIYLIKISLDEMDRDL